MLGLQIEHIDRLKDELSRRANEVEVAANEARQRLTLALSHEQAVTTAWAELDLWHAKREARFKAYEQKLAQSRPLRTAAPGLGGFGVAAPLARPAGCGPVDGSSAVTVSVSNA